MALWAGRFKKEINENVNAFNSSISFDARMYKHDIMGSIAHASMSVSYTHLDVYKRQQKLSQKDLEKDFREQIYII